MNLSRLRTIVMTAAIPLLVIGVAICSQVGLSKLHLMQKPTGPVTVLPLLNAKQTKVLASSDHTSPENAAAEATLKAGDWVRSGWTAVSISSTYSMQENEGTTITGTPTWTVYVLLTCTQTPSNHCTRLTPP